MTLNSHKLRIAFIGCVSFSEKSLISLLAISNKNIEICAVVTKSISSINDDHKNLTVLAKQNDIPCLDFTFEPENLETFLTSINPDIIYCFGWSHLLNANILNIAKHGVVGFHPSKLPENRGRHPIIWALVLGLSQTASTFFKMNEGADSGPIICQKVISIDESDNATTLYEKIIRSALKQIPEFTLDYLNNHVEEFPQDNSNATYWRKRSQADGIIDWRMSSCAIYNLVRALTKPYCGAEFIYKNKTYKVWESMIIDDTANISVTPGTLMNINKDEKAMLIKCGDNSIIKLKGFSCFDDFIIGEQL